MVIDVFVMKVENTIVFVVVVVEFDHMGTCMYEVS